MHACTQVPEKRVDVVAGSSLRALAHSSWMQGEAGLRQVPVESALDDGTLNTGVMGARWAVSQIISGHRCVFAVNYLTLNIIGHHCSLVVGRQNFRRKIIHTSRH